MDPSRASNATEVPVNAQPYVDEALRWLPDVMADVSERHPVAGAGKYVLLADDNTDMREYVRRLLETNGYRVRAVADGQQALDAARAEPTASRRSTTPRAAPSTWCSRTS